MIAKRCERHGLQLIQPKAVSGPQILSSLPSGPKGKRTEKKGIELRIRCFSKVKKTTGKDKKQKNMYPYMNGFRKHAIKINCNLNLILWSSAIHRSWWCSFIEAYY